MRVMAIGANPDDLELQCGGTLLKCKQRGDEVIMCVATNGSMGHFYILSPHLSAIRKREARQSARICGAEIILLDLPDAGPFPSPAQRDLFVEAIRQADPDLILTHYPYDYMTDHCYTAQNVIDASFWCAIPQYYTTTPGSAKVPAVFFFEPVAGLGGFQPTEYVDVTDVWEKKVEMLLCHQSQARWLKEHDGIDYVEFMAATARFRGLQCGVQYAEAFMPMMRWPRVKAERLLP
jgi:LmbE family N-acetylglucosaminyl deacetylase